MHRGTRYLGVGLAIALACVAVPSAQGSQDAACTATSARTSRPAQGVADPAGDVRVYAIQYKHEMRHVETYESFARKMDCLVRLYVLPTADGPDPDEKADRATIVAFNEDAGLATIATGTRGAAARALAEHGPKDPREFTGAQAAFAALAPGHAPAIARYADRAPETSAPRLILAAATDLFVRGFMKANSDLARRYGIYVVSSNNQAEFRETNDPAAIAALADPDLAARYASGELTSVYEAVDVGPSIAPPETTGDGRAGIDVYNQAFMWAPADPPADSPAQLRYRKIQGGELSPEDPRRNIVHVTRKTPLTTIERAVLDLSDDGDMRASNTGPFCLLPEHDPSCKARIGYGISLPAFKWGTPFGVPLGESADPCASPGTWMRCLDDRGVTVFLQPEANPGMWAEYIDVSWNPAAWQALSWMDSAWRAVADPTVRSIRYAVTPHLVGNLVDLTFDGQSVVFERCLPTEGGGDTCNGNAPASFVGASTFQPCSAGRTTRCDDEALAPYHGSKRETIVMAGWVATECPSCSSPTDDRERLAAIARSMQAGSGSPSENDYLETAVWADLDLDRP